MKIEQNRSVFFDTFSTDLTAEPIKDLAENVKNSGVSIGTDIFQTGEVTLELSSSSQPNKFMINSGRFGAIELGTHDQMRGALVIKFSAPVQAVAFDNIRVDKPLRIIATELDGKRHGHLEQLADGVALDAGVFLGISHEPGFIELSIESLGRWSLSGSIYGASL